MRKKLIALLLIATVVSMFIPMRTMAQETGDFDVTGNSAGYNFADGVLSFTASGTYSVSMATPGATTTQHRIIINAGTTGDPVNVTLNGVNIDVSGTNAACAFDTQNNSVVKLFIADGSQNTLASGREKAGLHVPGNAVLTIDASGDGSGELEVRGGYGGAGLGGNDRGSVGSITICGGTVRAWGGVGSVSSGAGIGGGVYGNGGVITITGGTVAAWGGSDGAGIGGGQSGSGGNITISGGTVTAQGGSYGAGIGGGWARDGGNIVISGGTVTAQGGFQGSGIGGGGRSGSGGSVAISGGTITARGGSLGAGIGGGGAAGLGIGGVSGTITISGGTVTAAGGSSGSVGGAGIGGGGGSGDGGGGSGGNIIINGGTITAQGGNNGAGIGGGSGASIGGAGGTVQTDGENTAVSATGGNNAYDIGSGNSNSTGGSLSLANNATVLMNRNGTDADTSFITGTVGGNGAGLYAGTYLNSQKLLSISNLTASPVSGAKAFDNVTLTVQVSGLSQMEAQGQIAFYVGGTEIGRSSLTRVVAGSANATAEIVWSSRTGTHTITAQYIQNETADSYYTIGGGQIAGYNVEKSEQATLSINGIPDRVTYGDEPFNLSVGGGSGTGSISYLVVMGDAISVSSSGTVTVLKAGSAMVYVIKSGDTNYLQIAALVSITVNKALPPTVVFPSASTVTYEQKLSDSMLSGGSGDGSFTWESPDTEPTVNNYGYTVIFTPRDTANFDYAGITLIQTVNISVNKAAPAVTFPSAGEIPYEQPLSTSALTGGSGDGSFDWESPETIPTVINSGYYVIFTPNDTDNYHTVTQTVPVSVLKAEQASLVIDGIPDTVTFGGPSFELLVSGGSGTGNLSYEVTAGNAVSIDANGTITIEKAGEATVRVTKAADSNYHLIDTTVNLTVNKANPVVVFPSAGMITFGQPLSASHLIGGSGDGSFEWESPNAVPNVINNGFDMVFIPNDTDNYRSIKQTVALTVAKAVQAPLIVSGIPDILTYGDAPFWLIVDGGSGTGTYRFSVVAGNAVTVDDSGKVTINQGGSSSIRIIRQGDRNHLPESRTILLTVNKAKQSAVLIFTMPDTIRFGDASFQIIGSGGNGKGEFGYQVISGESVSVSQTGIVTVLQPGESVITAIKASDGNHLSQQKTIRINVDKGIQKALVISGIPQRISVGQAPFHLTANGGSGRGAFSFAISSGNAVRIDTNGIVTILGPGTAVLTVTKSADDYYHKTTMTVEIEVRRDTSDRQNEATEPTSSSPSPMPSPTKTPPSPEPTPTNDIPKRDDSIEQTLTISPRMIETDEEAGTIIFEINVSDLPEGTTSIIMPNGETIMVGNADTLRISLSIQDIDENGILLIAALNKDGLPLASIELRTMTDTITLPRSTNEGRDIWSVIIWVLIGLVGTGLVAGTIYKFLRIRKNS